MYYTAANIAGEGKQYHSDVRADSAQPAEIYIAGGEQLLCRINSLRIHDTGGIALFFPQRQRTAQLPVSCGSRCNSANVSQKEQIRNFTLASCKTFQLYLAPQLFQNCSFEPHGETYRRFFQESQSIYL